MTNDSTILTRNATGLDHVAIAVPRIEPAISFYCNQLGFELLERRDTVGEATGMTSAVLCAGPITVVLVQGTSSASQVSRYIDRYGPGVQHIAIGVHDLPNIVGDLQDRDMNFGTGIIEGDGIRQAFTSRDPHSGMMYELIERQRPDGRFTDESVRDLFCQLEDKGEF